MILDILLAIAVVHGWWHAALIIGIIGLLRFPYFVEIVIAGIAYDALFHSSLSTNVLGHLGFIIAAILSVSSAGFKKLIR